MEYPTAEERYETERRSFLDEQEKRQIADRKVRLYRTILRHLCGIVTAIAELDIGEKVRLKD